MDSGADQTARFANLSSPSSVAHRGQEFAVALRFRQLIDKRAEQHQLNQLAGKKMGLATPHPVGIYDSGVHLLGQVTVPSGKTGYNNNNFYWAQLDPPLLLRSNTAYYVAAMTSAGDGDWWGDSFSPSSWNAFFVGSQGSATRQSAQAPSGSAWPAPSFSTVSTNSTFLLEGLANLPNGPAKAGVETNLLVASALGQNLSLAGFASGAPTITYLWDKNGSPLATQTNSTLTLNNVSSFDNGTYFLTATNSSGGEQSANVTVAVSPVIQQFPQVTASPIMAYSGANPTFSFSSVAGIQPFSYGPPTECRDRRD